MNCFKRISVLRAILTLLLLAGLGPIQADNYNRPPRLFTLTVPGLQTDPSGIDIPIQFGDGKTTPIAQSDAWRIFDGSLMEQRPKNLNPIMVELHGTVGKVRKIIARVMVRYYQDERGLWQPLYQLNQEPLMVKTPQGWRPLFDTRESPEVLGVMNRGHPNPAGYRPSIDFKVQRGKVSIDSWVIKQHR